MARNKTRGQMEILGLAVIVLLISVGLLFMIMTSLKAKPSTKKMTFENKLLSSNTINVLLRMTSSEDECGAAVMSDLVLDMFGGSGTKCVGGSKEYVNRTINDLLAGTLQQWGKEYVFVIYRESNPASPMVALNNTNETLNIEATPYPLPNPYGPDQIIVRLDIVNRYS